MHTSRFFILHAQLHAFFEISEAVIVKNKDVEDTMRKDYLR